MFRGRFVGVVAAAALLVAVGGSAGCGGSKDGSKKETAHPPATDDEAFEAIQDVLAQIDASWEKLAGDPSVADESGNPEMRKYEGLHTPDAPTLASSVEWLQDLAGEGRAQRAPAGRPYQQTLMVTPRVVDPDTVKFSLCRTLEVEVIDSPPGEAHGIDRRVLRQYEGPLVFVGEGEARRVDGRWRLHRFKGQQSMLLGKDDGEPVQWYSTTIDVECDLDAFDLPG